jgi:hypothetical protein
MQAIPISNQDAFARWLFAYYSCGGMVISGIQIDDHEPFPFFNPIRIVEVQHFGRDPTFGGQGGDGGPFQPKVVSPYLSAWTVEGDQLSAFGIIRADIVSFVAVTTGAGQGQIVSRGFAIMLSGNDMVRLMFVSRDALG